MSLVVASYWPDRVGEGMTCSDRVFLEDAISGRLGELVKETEYVGCIR